MNAAFPDRFNSVITSGDEHTFIMRRFDFVIGSTSVRKWITDMVNANGLWDSERD